MVFRWKFFLLSHKRKTSPEFRLKLVKSEYGRSLNKLFSRLVRGTAKRHFFLIETLEIRRAFIPKFLEF